MYLKSPRRRREKFFNSFCIEKYFSVPKIASPEARTNFLIRFVQGQVPKNPGAEPSIGAEQREKEADQGAAAKEERGKEKEEDEEGLPVLINRTSHKG